MSDLTRRVYLVCYDISSNSRVKKVYKKMRAYGDHLQFSVFRCVLSGRQRAAMEGELLDLIDVTVDQVLIVPLGLPEQGYDAAMRTLGLPLTHPERSAVVV